MNLRRVRWAGAWAAMMLSAVAVLGQGTSVKLDPKAMPRVGAVDERFQSYNIEAVEITGGRFWKPFASIDAMKAAKPAEHASGAPAGMDPNLFEYRPPIDLSNAKLRKLAAALGPAYVRVSGTWMNSSFFDDSDGPAPTTPPKGFNSVLTRAEWKGVIDFTKATDAELVTSFATSMGTRDAAGVWTPDQAEKIAAYTKKLGGHIAAAEFMNEPTFATMAGAPQGYDAAAYAKDFAVFTKFAREDEPGMKILGPGGVMEQSGRSIPGMHPVTSADILAATGPTFDAFSYHAYPGVSQRCARAGMAMGTSPDDALTAAWLAKAGEIGAFYAGIRDKGLPAKPMWLTETAQVACGGDRWASDFIDSFRYLNQLGSLAKMGVVVHMHNTLASSDYGLLDEKTYDPRPNYWAALLWRKLMGTTVLDAGSSPAENLHLYAQCLRGTPGGVTLLAINADKAAAQSLTLPVAAERYTLTSSDLMSQTVELNGVQLKLGAGNELPKMKGETVKSGDVSLAPESITFLAMPKANNASCK